MSIQQSLHGSGSLQGPTHRLEINTPRDMEDLSTDEEEVVHGQMRNYERKIETLMSEMGSLRNEVNLKKMVFVIFLVFTQSGERNRKEKLISGK